MWKGLGRMLSPASRPPWVDTTQSRPQHLQVELHKFQSSYASITVQLLWYHSRLWVPLYWYMSERYCRYKGDSAHTLPNQLSLCRIGLPSFPALSCSLGTEGLGFFGGSWNPQQPRSAALSNDRSTMSSRSTKIIFCWQQPEQWAHFTLPDNCYLKIQFYWLAVVLRHNLFFSVCLTVTLCCFLLTFVNLPVMKCTCINGLDFTRICCPHARSLPFVILAGFHQSPRNDAPSSEVLLTH